MENQSKFVFSWAEIKQFLNLSQKNQLLSGV
jgi:hypothetical protein